MTTDVPASAAPDPDVEGRAMVLRGSPTLQQVPAERAPAAPAAPAAAAASPVAVSPAGMEEGVLPAPGTLRERLLAGPPPQLAWGLASVALAAGIGWVVERRRRRLLEMERDSVMWASVRNPLKPGAPRRPNLDEILPDSPDPEESVRSIYASAIGETTSRREATLIDLHQLDEELQRLRDQHDITGAAELLEQHLVDFRYTSPWAFLELRELYRQLERPNEWDLARDAFRNRFGQNAPQFQAPSSVDDEIADDKQLCADIVRKWPHRDARMFMLRWMLGDPTSRQKCSGPPQLALGVYRDMLLLDAVLDEAMQARPAAAAA